MATKKQEQKIIPEGKWWVTEDGHKFNTRSKAIEYLTATGAMQAPEKTEGNE
ncbi:MAG: hypothetical protein LBG77_01760 [Dysgonamonadaceae bacterium]|jgi:hypothetical protein|nr:hypothetical protein [Dysgonamonadaceae bacterium]